MKTAVIYKNFTSQRKFGIELEIGCTVSKIKIQAAIKEISLKSVVVTRYQPSIENGFWHIKSDATCGPKGRLGPKGVEIASFVAKGNYDLQHICNVSQSLSKLGCKVNDNCGLHIHADSSDLTVNHVGTLLAYWIKLEKCLQYALPERRRTNEYCRMVSARYLLPKYLNILDYVDSSSTKAANLYLLLSPSNIGYYENSDRRQNLNLVNYARALNYFQNGRNTLELRWPEGSLDPADISGWTRLFLGFIESCKDRSFPQNIQETSLIEVLDFCGLWHSPDGFTIFGKESFDTRVWLLERFAKYESPYKNEARELLDLICSPAKKYA